MAENKVSWCGAKKKIEKHKKANQEALKKLDEIQKRKKKKK